METTNLSKIRREKMLNTISEIKKNITDEKMLTNLSMIENELTKKKYGLIWEEHEERVDKELETQIPTFEEIKDKEIVPLIDLNKGEDNISHIFVSNFFLYSKLITFINFSIIFLYSINGFFFVKSYSLKTVVKICLIILFFISSSLKQENNKSLLSL